MSLPPRIEKIVAVVERHAAARELEKKGQELHALADEVQKRLEALEKQPIPHREARWCSPTGELAKFESQEIAK